MSMEEVMGMGMMKFIPNIATSGAPNNKDQTQGGIDLSSQGQHHDILMVEQDQTLQHEGLEWIEKSKSLSTVMVDGRWIRWLSWDW